MRRRDFIKGISVWTALPLAARTQPREQKRHVDVVRSKTIGVFVTSVALCALSVAIDTPAFARGGAGRHGGLHGGGGFHGGGSHTRGRLHGAAHDGQASSSRSLAAHSRHVGHAGRFASHSKRRGGHSAPNAHNLGGAAQGQLAHEVGVTRSQFAAESFHGLNNFNTTGFNRSVRLATT
jgi:hypothetical protein